jgi:DNA-binding winged helix-turn-helix (wHTH) protein
VQRIGSDPSIHAAANAIEDVAAFLLPAATLHIAVSVAFEGQRPLHATWSMIGAYALGLATGFQAVVDPGHPIAIDAPHAVPLGVDPVVAGWAFILLRAAIFGAAIAYLIGALRRAGDDQARQRQLKVALATVALGVIGGMLRILPESLGGPKWVGVSLVALAMVAAAYAVLAQHLFLAAEAAGRAFRWSIVMGLGVVAYVAALLLLDRAAAAWLGLDLPLILALAVVVTIVLLEPISDAVRHRLAERSGRDPMQSRLLRALGDDIITVQEPGRAVVPALARLIRSFDLTGATVLDREGRPVASAGEPPPAESVSLSLALESRERRHGTLLFGPKRSGLPLLDRESRSLELAAAYLGGSLGLADRQVRQASALEELSADSASVRARENELSQAIADAAAPPAGLYVYALGPLRAERDGSPVTRWGGAKAGSRQAEAVFAFLFDRGERGVAKDEILELVWPDVDLDRADVAFHRTMLGLRSMLQPDRRASRRNGVITFHNDRYRLDRSVVAWSDLEEFERLVAGSDPGDEGLRALERARGLYRGDFLDDCPYYGDSAEVEARRAALRARYVDLLVDLGERYAAHGERARAADCLRDARAITGDEPAPLSPLHPVEPSAEPA